jgi:hypothetical protein
MKRNRTLGLFLVWLGVTIIAFLKLLAAGDAPLLIAFAHAAIMSSAGFVIIGLILVGAFLALK